jgi:hypothetical protein
MEDVVIWCVIDNGIKIEINQLIILDILCSSTIPSPIHI